MRNSSALGWEANSSGQRFGIGQTNGGLYFFRTTSAFGTTATGSNLDLLISDNGDLLQARNKSGVVKAMIYVDPFLPASQYIVRCYNGIANSSTGNCGFTVTRAAAGEYYINLGFQVNDRFLSVTTPSYRFALADIAVQANTAYVATYHPSGAIADGKFYLFIY